MTFYPNNLEDTLIKILSEHTACIAHEINDRAYYEYDVPFESFRDLRIVRDGFVSSGRIKEVLRNSPYGNPYKFYYLIVESISNVDRAIKIKHKWLLAYSEHTRKIGDFGEHLVAEATRRLGFANIKVRKHPGKRDVDVWCKDRNRSFYWAIECKNRRQEIHTNDIAGALSKAKKAFYKWNVETKPALVSSSIYNRIPEDPPLLIIPTENVYVPKEDFFYQYKKALGSWFLKPVNGAPDDLTKLLDISLK